ncbi:ribonuclease H-like domain-containing protein, partial [Tanacetum coccineum]
FQDTTRSKKKEAKVFTFYKVEEEGKRYVAACFVGGLHAYDGEINLDYEKNVISNEFVVKLCLEYEEKNGEKLVKRELLVSLRGEFYFVKFKINQEEDDVEPSVILGRSFVRLAKGVVDFENGIITIHPDFDLYSDDSDLVEKSDNDWGSMFNLDDVPETNDVELPPLICKMGKSSRNKKRALEEAAREELGISICGRFDGFEEERPVLKNLAYEDKYRKLHEEICLEKMKLDEEIKEEEKEVVKRVKEEALIEKDDPGAFIFLIRLEGKINLNALADTGSKINVMRYRIYMELGRDRVKKVNRGITMINRSVAKPMGLLKDVLYQVGVTTIIAKLLILDTPIDRDAPIVVGRGFLFTCGNVLNTISRVMSTYDVVCHQTFRATRTTLNTAESDSDDEEEYSIKRNKFEEPIYGPRSTEYLNLTDPMERSLQLQDVLNPFHKICVWKKAVCFLGSLPVPIQHVDWKPEYYGCHKNEEERTGQWRAGIRLTDPYRNVYNQGFTTKKTSRKLAKYHKLSDIMSPNYFQG